MSDTPDQNKPLNEDSQRSPEKAPEQATPSSPRVKAPSKPVKPPSKPAPQPDSQPAAQTPSKPAPKPKPASVTPAAKKQEAAKAKKPDSSITSDEKDVDDSPSVPMLVIDGLAAVIAVTFTVLILRDVMPFL